MRVCVCACVCVCVRARRKSTNVPYIKSKKAVISVEKNDIHI